MEFKQGNVSDATKQQNISFVFEDEVGMRPTTIETKRLDKNKKMFFTAGTLLDPNRGFFVFDHSQNQGVHARPQSSGYMPTHGIQFPLVFNELMFSDRGQEKNDMYLLSMVSPAGIETLVLTLKDGIFCGVKHEIDLPDIYDSYHQGNMAIDSLTSDKYYVAYITNRRETLQTKIFVYDGKYEDAITFDIGKYDDIKVKFVRTLRFSNALAIVTAYKTVNLEASSSSEHFFHFVLINDKDEIIVDTTHPAAYLFTLNNHLYAIEENTPHTIKSIVESPLIDKDYFVDLNIHSIFLPIYSSGTYTLYSVKNNKKDSHLYFLNISKKKGFSVAEYLLPQKLENVDVTVVNSRNITEEIPPSLIFLEKRGDSYFKPQIDIIHVNHESEAFNLVQSLPAAEYNTQPHGLYWLVHYPMPVFLHTSDTLLRFNVECTPHVPEIERIKLPDYKKAYIYQVIDHDTGHVSTICNFYMIDGSSLSRYKEHSLLYDGVNVVKEKTVGVDFFDKVPLAIDIDNKVVDYIYKCGHSSTDYDKYDVSLLEIMPIKDGTVLEGKISIESQHAKIRRMFDGE